MGLAMSTNGQHLCHQMQMQKDLDLQHPTQYLFDGLSLMSLTTQSFLPPNWWTMAGLHSASAVHSFDVVEVLSHMHDATFHHKVAACFPLPLLHQFLRKLSFLLSAHEHSTTAVPSRLQAVCCHLLLIPHNE
jgi:hypothetical protein